jgi:hypothetical protein
MTKDSQNPTAPKTTKSLTKSGVGSPNGDTPGEGNYSAARRFDAQEGAFVEKNRQKIPQLGKDAEKALDGAEGDALRKAEETARSHSHSPKK